MKSLKRILVVTGLLAIVSSSLVYASGSINKMSVTVRAPELLIEAVEEPAVTVSGGRGYYIDEVIWNNNPDTWKIGKTQRMTVRFVAEEGYSFGPVNSKSKWSVSGAQFVKCVRDQGDLLVTLDYGPPKIKLGEPRDAGWSKTEVGIARWRGVPNASAYEVVLYHSGEVKKRVTVNEPKADFSNEITNKEEVRFEVRAVARDSSQSRYLVAGEWVTGSDEFYYSDLGQTDGKWVSEGGGFKYQAADGTFAVSKWEMIVGNWYYFNEQSLRTTGWQFINGNWYYMDAEGKMKTGWTQLDGQWYYLHDSGVMAVGWLQTAPGVWYFLYDNGVMAKETSIGGHYLNETGLWVS